MTGPREVDRPALTEAYRRLGNVHKAAAEVGVSHSVAHRRLTAWGEMVSKNLLTEEDRDTIRAYYETTPAADFDLSALASRLARTRAVISREARNMGLTNPARPKSLAAASARAASLQGRWSRQPHPRGFAGGSHSSGARAIMSDKSREMWQRAKATGTGLMAPDRLQRLSDMTSARMALQPAETAYSRCKGGRRDDIGSQYFRSSWEANYARYLNWLLDRGEIDSWEYEPETFWFEKIRRGVRSYKPDFRVREKGAVYFVEVKGWMDPKSKTKLQRMKKYHPTVEVRVVAEKEYVAIASAVGRLIPNWEGRGSALRVMGRAA